MVGATIVTKYLKLGIHICICITRQFSMTLRFLAVTFDRYKWTMRLDRVKKKPLIVNIGCLALKILPIGWMAL